MSESKETKLNSSYYGPPIPPQQTRPPTGRATARHFAPYCLICAAFKAFTTILIFIGITALILWLIFQPDDLKVYVDNASLTLFDLDTNNTLYYNLTLDVSIRNPNKKIGIHYEHIEATAIYDGSKFGQEDFPRFHQHRKSTKMLHVSFQGQLSSGVGSSMVGTYKREKGEGWFYISVKMYTKVRLKMIVVKSIAYSPEVDCYLRIPAPSNGTSAGGFTRTKCDAQSFS